MKKHLKFLLGLALIVLILGGCQNPSGPETPEVNEPPVVETPEDNANKTKVEFVWAAIDENFESQAPKYFLDLHFDSELNSYVYGIPEGYDFDSYKSLIQDTERFKKFSEDAFEEAFGTKYYKEGTTIDLTKWTSKAKRLTKTGEVSPVITWSYFSTKDISSVERYDIETDVIESPFDKIVVGSEDIVVYVCFNNKMF